MDTQGFKIILASGSPRRQHFFEEMGIPFSKKVIPVAEDFPENLKSVEIAQYIVKQKATKKFVVEEIGTGGEFTCTLATGKLPAALVAGEMSIMALGNDAETYNVAKISAKRVTLANPSATGNNVLGGLSQAWQMGAAASAGVVRIEEAGDDNTLIGTDDDDFTEDA